MILTPAGHNRVETGGIPSLVGTTTAHLTTGLGTLTLPPSMAEDDLVVVLLVADAAANWAVPTGWTRLYDGVSQNSPTYAVDYKVMGSTPDSTYSIEGDDVTFDATGAIATAYRGVDAVNPFDVESSVSSGATGLPNPPDITTTVANTLVFAVGFVDDLEVDDFSAPSGFTDLTYAYGVRTSPPGTAVVSHKEVATAGSVSVGIYTGTGSDEWKALTVALSPE